MELTQALPWITVFHPVAPLQEEAYLPLSGTVSPDDKKSLSLRKACADAYKSILESVEQHVLVFFYRQNCELILDLNLGRLLTFTLRITRPLSQSCLAT